jgi:hypothetical protein
MPTTNQQPAPFFKQQYRMDPSYMMGRSLVGQQKPIRHWSDGLANGVNKMMGAYLMRSAQKDADTASTDYNKGMVEAIQTAQGAKPWVSPDTITGPDGEVVARAGEVAPGTSKSDAMIQALMKSDNPALSSQGSSLMAQALMKGPEERFEDVDLPGGTFAQRSTTTGKLANFRDAPAPQEQFEVVNSPYGRGGSAQRSSLTGKLANYQGPKEEGQRRIVEGGDGYKYYADTGDRVLPNVKKGSGLTMVHQRENAGITQARKTLDDMGLDRAEIMRRSRKVTETGRDNPDHDPFLEKLVTTATKPLYGDDPDGQRYQDLIFNQPSPTVAVDAPLPGTDNEPSLLKRGADYVADMFSDDNQATAQTDAQDIPRTPEGGIDRATLKLGSFYRIDGKLWKYDGQGFEGAE